MKHNTKYSYVAGQRFEHHGSRTYDFDGKRLPSVTTILAQTKDQSYITRWKDKVGEQEAERIKNHSSKRGTSMHKFLEEHISGKGYDDLSEIGKEAKPMAAKIMQAQRISCVCIMIRRPSLILNRAIAQSRRIGSRIIISRLQPTPWPMITSTSLTSSRVLL